MQTKKYILGEDFIVVEPCHIDKRLTHDYCSKNLVKEIIACNITNILIYKDFIKNSPRERYVCIQSTDVCSCTFKTNRIYGSDNEPNYCIHTNIIMKVLNDLPLNSHISRHLVDHYGFSYDKDYIFGHSTNIWHKIFNK